MHDGVGDGVESYDGFESKEDDSGVVLSPVTSGQTSPEKKALRPTSIQLRTEERADMEGSSPDASYGNKATVTGGSQEDSGRGDADRQPQAAVGRSLSAPNGPTAALHLTVTPPALTPATTPTRNHYRSSSSLPTPTAVGPQLLSSPSHPPPLSSPLKASRPFNPFPVKHVNTNRARTGLKLGLYTPSTLQHIQGQLHGGSLGRKARNASS